MRKTLHHVGCNLPCVHACDGVHVPCTNAYIYYRGVTYLETHNNLEHRTWHHNTMNVYMQCLRDVYMLLFSHWFVYRCRFMPMKSTFTKSILMRRTSTKSILMRSAFTKSIFMRSTSMKSIFMGSIIGNQFSWDQLPRNHFSWDQSYKINSHEINFHKINSHEVNFYEINSHEMNHAKSFPMRPISMKPIPTYEVNSSCYLHSSCCSEPQAPIYNFHHVFYLDVTHEIVYQALPAF